MSEKAEIEKASTVERWWSVLARNHTPVVAIEGKGVGVKFNSFSLVLDLTNPRDKAISAGLKDHPQCGVSFYLVEGPYPETAEGEKRKVAMLRMLRKILTDATAENRVRVKAMEQVRALFSHAELAKAKLDSVTEDMDALLNLAIKTKSLKGLE